MSSSSEQEKNNDGDHNNNNNNNINGSLKKGTWSKDEDKILIDYMRKYGNGNWNAIQKRTELARDGKSCRLRWNNHLKPGVKKGKFSQHEEREVIRMTELGLQWCQMAQQLPGRSDNDIKNFCNAKKRKQDRILKLSGSSSLNDDHKLHDNGENSLSGSTSKQVDDSQEDKFNIPKVEFKKHNFHRIYPSNHVEMNENNYSKQLPNLFDVPNKQLPKFPKLVDDSNMFYNNVGSTSISNHPTPTWIDRASIGTSFMHKAMVPNPSPFPRFLNFQNMYNPLPSIEHSLHRKYPSRYDEINENNSEKLPNLFDVPNKQLPKWVDDSKMPYKYVGSTSTSKHTTPTWINRGGNGTSSKQFTMVPNPLPPCSYVQNMEYQLPSYKKLGEYPQNLLPPPKEAQYQRTGSVSPYRSSSRESIFLTHINLVDEKGKKPISFENDFGANFFSNFTDPCLHPASSLLDNDDNNNLNDKLPRDVKDTLDGAINERGIDWDIVPNFCSLDNADNNNLHDILQHDVKDTLDAAINERGIYWDILHNFGSLDNNDNNNLHGNLPHEVKGTLVAAKSGKGIVSDHLPDLSLSDNDNNNNLHNKIPHNIKDTLEAVIYGKSFHPK